MFVGMTTVLLFLCFMILLLQLVAKLTRGITEKELELIEIEKNKRALLEKKRKEKLAAAGAPAHLDNDEEIAVISAAIAAFEAEKAAAS